MSKSWAIFFLIVGILVLVGTAIQIIFLLNPAETTQVKVFNPAKPDPNLEVEVLFKIAENQKYIKIDSDTIQPYEYRPFILPERYSGLTSSEESAGQ